MYIKWIVCNVPSQLQKQFLLAQEAWSKTSKSKGFIGQTGGWNIKNTNEACIISFWKNKESLQHFMNNLHDVIFANNNQIATYSSIKVSYFNALMNIEGELKNISDVISNSKLIRIADCIVKEDKINHFEEVQKTIWIPTMKKATGILGGKFSINEQHKLNYLVSTFWDSETHHQNYIKTQLPVNQKNAKIEVDLKSITGKLVLIEKSWNVISK